MRGARMVRHLINNVMRQGGSKASEIPRVGLQIISKGELSVTYVDIVKARLN